MIRTMETVALNIEGRRHINPSLTALVASAAPPAAEAPVVDVASEASGSQDSWLRA